MTQPQQTIHPGTDIPNCVAEDNTALLEQARLRVFCESLALGIAAAPRQTGGKCLPRRLTRAVRVLSTANAGLLQALRHGASAAEAARLIVDNFYFVEAQAQKLRHSIAARRTARLPAVFAKEGRTTQRIEHFASSLVAHVQGTLNTVSVLDALTSYQVARPLDLAELWVLPDMLALALLELLANAAVRFSADDETRVRACINSLRFLENTRWRDIVDQASATERILARDPAGCYRQMDFITRNSYRQILSKLSDELAVTEMDVADAALSLAREAAETDKRRREAHIGYYLIDAGLDSTRAALGANPRFHRLRRRGYLSAAYLTAQAVAALTCLTPLLTPRIIHAPPPAIAFFVPFLLWLVSAQISVPLVNALFSIRRPSMPMPRMDYRKGVPAHARTWVVVPCLLESPRHVGALLESLRMRFLANRTPNVCYALLSDLPDADQRALPGDDELVELIADGIRNLNIEYSDPESGGDLFFLLHRDRSWNASQGRWLGYERKRGKLHALNALLLRGYSHEFSRIIGKIKQIGKVQYIITIDTDTHLPWGAARRLIETIDHPLNRPTWDSDGVSIVAGYTIIQPQVSPLSAGNEQTRYAEWFGGKGGLGQYTHASANFYHDVFGEGCYNGKGIYDIRAYERALKNRLPENAILSHDLVEGCFARATTATDIEVFEEHPLTYGTDIRRRQRWIRGDWQIAGWLGSPVPVLGARPVANTLSALSRWKLFDNLRTSLFEPACLALLCVSWLAPSVSPMLAAVPLLALAQPSMAQLGLSLFQRIAAICEAVAHQPISQALLPQLGRAVFMAACLPHASWEALRSIAKTAWRLGVSGRNLLEWETFATLQRRSHAQPEHPSLNRDLLTVNLACSAIIACTIRLLNPGIILLAAPWLCLWIAAPFFDLWVSRSTDYRSGLLAADKLKFIRQAARRTWAFFEDHVDAASNWLPPDHVRVFPQHFVASRTSPTNIGLGLLSTVAAHDLGYLDTATFLRRVRHTLEAVVRLDRYRGHLYNWYDTRTLEPLAPMYVSAVDSGNFVAHVLVLRQSLAKLPPPPLFPLQLLRGLQDTFDAFCAFGPGLNPTLAADFVDRLTTLLDSVDPLSGETQTAVAALTNIGYQLCESLAADAGEALTWASKLRTHCRMVESELAYASAANRPEAQLQTQREQLIALCNQLTACSFRLFYDEERELLHIGFDTSTRRCDSAHYDMLASEARLTTYLAIARNDIPADAWFRLGRLQTCENGVLSLLSWSGSMFEYLMPNLVMPSAPHSLLDTALRGAVARQVRYGKSKRVPWGISESGYANLEHDGGYCYRAFGVPQLGLQPGLAAHLVIAPYASALALLVDPRKAADNLLTLARRGYLTAWGFYEAIDFTLTNRTRDPGPVIVREFMAHHQGMSLLAFTFAADGDNMQRRFQSDAELRAATVLLKELTPTRIPIVSPGATMLAPIICEPSSSP